MPFGETIVALGTPSGESALAVVRASGPLCPELVRQCLPGSGRREPRKAFLSDYQSAEGKVLDNCLALFFEDGKSYTGEPMLELYLHGNPLIVQRVLEDLLARGCRMAEPGEFTRTAFANGKLDLTQAEAVADLISARSERALYVARQQLGGSIGTRMEAYRERLLEVIAALEAYIDFPEEDLPAEDQQGPLQTLVTLTRDLAELIETSRYKALLHEGIRTVIVGAPNAGKSSLLNALLGEDRAIVSAIPGTTRDVISERIMVGSYCLNIMDTAGIHDVTEEIEKLGIARSKQKLAEADFILLVLDSAAPLPSFDNQTLQHFSPGKTLVIENKTDLPDSRPCSDFLPQCPHVRLSLQTNEHLSTLRATLIQILEKDRIVPDENATMVSSRHAAALSRALQAIQLSRQQLQDGISAELAVTELRIALDAIGEVVGKVDNEAMLDKLFATFCIGK